MLTIFHSPQAPMKRIWNPIFPKIILFNCASHSVKGRAIFENQPDQPWVLIVGQNEYNHYFGYMLLNPSRDVDVSLARYSYAKSVRLGRFKSVENDPAVTSQWRYTIDIEGTHGFFFIFRIKIQPQASTIFSLGIFLYYFVIHMVHERVKYTPCAHIFPGL